MRHNHYTASIVVAAALGLASCSSLPPGSGSFGGRVEFEAADGRQIIRMLPRASGVRVADDSGTTLVEIWRNSGHVVLHDGDGNSLGSIHPPTEETPAFRIMNGGDAPAYWLRAEPDGDFELQDANRERLYEIKRRNYGFKIVRADGTVESRVRSLGGRTSIRDAEGLTYLKTRDHLPPAATAALSLEQLPFALATGLAVAIVQWPPSAAE